MLTLRANFAIFCALLVVSLSGYGFGQSGSMSVLPGLNTVQNRINASAAPDVTIAVGLNQYCEHVNSAYQCWYKSGPNANQPVNFLGGTTPKSDSGPWSQNSNNGGNTSHCPTAFTPNSQIIHDNVYNLWILEKRITAAGGGHNYMCVAISNVEDVSNPSFSWFAFEFDLDTVIPTNSQGNFYYPDYPQVGLWQTSTTSTAPYAPASDQAMWISYDLEDVNSASNINGVLICAVDLAGLRASTTSPWVNNSKTPACTVAHTLVAFNQRRSWVPANNSDTVPPVAADGEMFTYMIQPAKNGKAYLTDPNHTQGVEQWTINWSSATPKPTLVNSWDLPSTQAGGDQLGCFLPNAYYNTICTPQPSTSATGIHIDSLGDRMQGFFHYTSNGGQGSIWTSAHQIQIVPNATAHNQIEADVRVLQRNTTAPNAMFLAGDYPMLDPSDSSMWVILPSVARDRAGNLQGVFGISGAGVNQHPGLDSVLFNPGTHASSTYGYIASPITSGDAQDTDNLNYRWGDWNSAVVDPTDGCTIWVAGEYLAATRTTEPYWYTQMASLPAASTCSSGPVLLSSVSLNFGSRQVGAQSTPLVETIKNNQSVPLNINVISTGSNDFTQTNTCLQQAIAPQGSCSISVTFTPSVSGARIGTLTITDDASNSPQTIALAGSGSAATLSLSATTLAFGNEPLNIPSVSQTVTVTNNSLSSITISSVSASGGYTQTGNCGGAILAPGQSCTITVTFSPTIVGSVAGTITINDNATGAPHIVTLTGTGQVALSFAGSLTFPATNVGTSSAPLTATITNNTNQTLTLTATTSSNYSAVGNGTSPCGSTLVAKAKCTYGVTFTPTSNGLAKGVLVVSYNAAGSPAVGNLQGTGQNGGAAPFTFTPVNLSFGNVALNTASSKVVTVKNVSAAAVTISSLTGSGYYTVAASGTTPCTGSVAAGKTCTMTVTFTPLATGTSVGGIAVVDNAAVNTQIFGATGNGVLPITMSPTSVSFGATAVGSTSAVQVVTVTNTQTTAVTINSVVASGDFLYTSGGATPCGTSVPASGSCTLGVKFSPTVTGAISGNLTFSYGAGSSPQSVSLSGTGQ